MLPMRQLILMFFLTSSAIIMSAQQTTDARPGSLTATPRIVQVTYCRADADVFTVSLKLEIDVVNSSKSALYLLWPMVPWEGKVAASVPEARSGHFHYQQTASHYPQTDMHFDRLKIGPGKKLRLESGYDLIARHDPAFSLPNSVSAGAYALVLLLRSEEEPSNQILDPRIIDNITTEPFVVHVPPHPKLVACGAGTKAR